ncbi:MAG TPA: DPP IV N-terminal domain-containing protein [Bryobacteraceae bacterium]|jgi:Tol biopolymer transport system component|nr:DPP IV N-terminal domain-containing protein [Bryobacteraceae bacterium]
MSFRVVCTATIALLCALPARTEPRYRIAFQSFAPRNQDIFLADADGANAKPLASHIALDSNASFSPDGKWVVFTSTRAGSADLFRVHPDGSGLERLTDSLAFDDQATFSPDGGSIAFVSSRTGQADIWILNIKTRKLVNVTNHPQGDFRPAWSPDGRWIAFSTDRDSTETVVRVALRHSTEIYAVHPDGTGLRRITHGNGVAGNPAWSADSSSILFYEAAPRQEATSQQPRSFRPPVTANEMLFHFDRSQIVSVDFKTGRREMLTTGEGMKVFPQWLEKGRVGYLEPWVASVGGLGPLQSRDGSIRFTSGPAGVSGLFDSPHWSPDGKRMVFHRPIDLQPLPVQEWFSPDSQFGLVRVALIFPSYSPSGGLVTGGHTAGNDPAGNKGIIVMNADGSGRRVIYPAKTAEICVAAPCPAGPVWSPLGDRIAFSFGALFAVAGPAHLATIRPDGTDMKMLTSGDRNDALPSWSPDGKRLVCRSVTKKGKGLSIVDIESGEITPLATGSEYDTFPAWSPRGDMISFTSNRDGDFEIYVIRADGSQLRRLTNTRGNDAHSAWSPDGEWIAFSTSRQGFKDEAVHSPGNFQPYGEVCVMRKDGSDARVLTDNATEEGAVSWIPLPRK